MSYFLYLACFTFDPSINESIAIANLEEIRGVTYENTKIPKKLSFALDWDDDDGSIIS